MTRYPLVLAACLAALAPLQQPVFRSRTDVVAIDASVMDGRRPVTTLTRDDFRLTDDGVAQTLLDFSREAMPLDVTLTIDVSGSVTPEKRSAIERAVRQVSETLRPGDRCGVVSFGQRVSEEAPMRDAPPTFSLENRSSGGTSLVDALLLSMVTAPMIDRRQLNLFLTDGVDTMSFFDAARVLDTIQYATGQASVVLVRGGDSNLTEGPMLDLLKKVTATGGGQIVTLNPGDELKATFLAAVEEFRTSYQLRYAPAGPVRPGWHTVVVTVPNGKYAVRARQGYWVQ